MFPSSVRRPWGSRLVAVLVFVIVVLAQGLVPAARAQSGDKAVPAAPSNLWADDLGQTDLIVRWSDNSGNEDSFNISQLDWNEDPDNANHWDRVGTVDANVTGFRVSGLTPATYYRFRVRAHNASGYSAHSEILGVTTRPLAPSAPTSLAATEITYTTVSLSWQDNSGNETVFDIQHRNNRTDPDTWVDRGSVGANVTNFTDTSLSPNTSYSFRVRARNTGGSSAWSNQINLGTPQNPPAAPSGLVASQITQTGLRLTWTDNASNEDDFRVYRLDQGEADVPGNWDEIGAPNSDITLWDVTGLTPGTQYWFKVRARNGGGYSAYTGTVSATTLPSPPAAPTGLNATSITFTTVSLSWQDNSGSETAFDIQHRNNRTDPDTWVDRGSVGANVMNFTDTSLSPNTSYSFRVRARNTGGSSAWSNQINLGTPQNPPAAPSGLVASQITQTGLRLTWVDNASNEDDFRVYRLDQGEADVPGNWNEIGAPNSDILLWDVTGLTPGTQYWFKVRARNGGGYSDYTNTVAVSTNPLKSLNVYFDDGYSIDTIAWSSGFTEGYRVRLVAEGVNYMRGWEAKVPLPAGLEFDALDWELLQPGTVVDQGVSLQNPWWRVDFSECVYPDAEGRIPLVEFRIAATARPLLDTRLTPTACNPSSVEPAAAAYDDCEGHSRAFQAINHGTINPSNPVCVVGPWRMDFGLVALGQTATRTLSVSNQDNNRVLDGVVRVTDGHDCFHVVGDSVYSLLPGQSREFTISYHPVDLLGTTHGRHHAELVVHEEPWHCVSVDLSGQSGDRLVFALDPGFLRSGQSEDYVGVPLDVWVGLGGVDSAAGWKAALEVSEHLQVLSVESLVPMAPGSLLSATEIDVVFEQCQAVAVNEILPLARLTVMAQDEFEDCHAISARGPGSIGYPVRRACPAGSLVPFEYVNEIGFGCDDGSGGSNKPVAEPVGQPQSGIVPLEVGFAANAYDTDGPRSELHYYWMFGDGSFSVTENPTHSFDEPGTYTVWLNVFDGVADVNKPVTVVVDPVYIAGASGPPPAVALHRPSPNPFNPRVAIGFALPAEMPVRVEVYDLVGRLVRSLVDSSMPPGEHSVIWNGNDESGSPVPAGVYLVRLRTAEASGVQKLVLLR